MKLKELAEKAGLAPLQDQGDLEVSVGGGYTGDLLSDVMGHSAARSVWVTCQTHENIVAVAKLKNLAAIILVNGRTPDPSVLKKAREVGIPMFGTSAPAFAVSAGLHALLAEPKDR